MSMVIGILQVELIVGDSGSLKDKRRVVLSLKDRIHRAHNAAVAEVGHLDSRQAVRLGIAVVSNSGRHAGEMLDTILGQLRVDSRFVLADHQREILSGSGGD